ncbi:pseudaminic acid cytidylyltransferase [Helicobacter sp. 16-1353]|uniref:pseudaminic acid cytidylyltransferase n=1 Tax=Helicobacter sp. 16-1353 TaxID=2004996 RepID=UPI000DCE46D3|nr:pseudaminic acid cytidylyltransferase [Helicobacter sp. 16-1353]RAX54626.1 pseudaminic acid cytidylyltransferase [Helicobacter sp. 16-1353]
MKIAIIPARGGSKRIKNKNIKDFCGKPIISYAIDSAINSNIFDRVIVSTNSKEIMDIAIECGAEVPNLRSESLSDDFATTLDVMSYEVKKLDLDDDTIVCCIYPTTPLLKPEFLRLGLEKIPKNAYCFSACAFNSNPLRGFFIKDNKLILLDRKFEFSRTQDIEAMYYDAGQFYFGYAVNFANKQSIFSEDSTLVVLPEISVVDINTNDDWEIAEIKYKILCKQ